MLTAFLLLFPPPASAARDNLNITDWYIQDFHSDIVVNKDSTLLITEKITADCGNLPDKHGIFRTLPTQMYIDSNKTAKTLVDLQSITDFSGNKIKYSTTYDQSNHTVTWKIGDANILVHGVNNYQIVYKVKNVIRFNDSSFDELYWNLNGNFWKIETDKFSATVHFPSEINKSNAKVTLYSGEFGSKNDLNAQYSWLGSDLSVNAPTSFIAGEGVTASITFPKNVISPYKPTFIELYGQYLWLLLPLIIFIFCYKLWYSYGRDPKINSAVAPMFEIIDDLSPIDMGMLMTNGGMRNQYLSASIVNLAVNKVIKIEEIEKKSILGKKDYVLHLVKEAPKNTASSEKLLLHKLFGEEKEIKLSSLKDQFYKDIPSIKESSNKFILEEKYIDDSGKKSATIIGILMFLLFVLVYFSFKSLSYEMITASIAASLICSVFLLLMSKRTPKGAMAYHQILGFKLYIEMAEKYRQQFNEKENIFEKFLPYAILFGLTGKWIKAMKNIYGEEYFNSYHPVWFYGASISTFNVDSFAQSLNSVSSSMASTLSSSPSSSGSGGGGFSGGGGGGGGGGGW